MKKNIIIFTVIIFLLSAMYIHFFDKDIYTHNNKIPDLKTEKEKHKNIFHAKKESSLEGDSKKKTNQENNINIGSVVTENSYLNSPLTIAQKLYPEDFTEVDFSFGVLKTPIKSFQECSSSYFIINPIFIDDILSGLVVINEKNDELVSVSPMNNAIVAERNTSNVNYRDMFYPSISLDEANNIMQEVYQGDFQYLGIMNPCIEGVSLGLPSETYYAFKILEDYIYIDTTDKNIIKHSNVKIRNDDYRENMVLDNRAVQTLLNSSNTIDRIRGIQNINNYEEVLPYINDTSLEVQKMALDRIIDIDIEIGVPPNYILDILYQTENPDIDIKIIDYYHYINDNSSLSKALEAIDSKNIYNEKQKEIINSYK